MKIALAAAAVLVFLAALVWVDNHAFPGPSPMELQGKSSFE